MSAKLVYELYKLIAAQLSLNGGTRGLSLSAGGRRYRVLMELLTLLKEIWNVIMGLWRCLKVDIRSKYKKSSKPQSTYENLRWWNI